MHDEKGHKIIDCHPNWKYLRTEWNQDFSDVSFIEFDVIGWVIDLGTQFSIEDLGDEILSGMKMVYHPISYGQCSTADYFILKQPSGIFVMPHVKQFFKTEADLKTYLIADKNS